MINITNRLKKKESTLCTFTIDGREIKEGDVLGYGYNYPCVVLYNPFEAKFELIEFGYKDSCEDCAPYRTHDLLCNTSPFKILGDIDRPSPGVYNKLKELQIPDKFNYAADIQEYYKHTPAEEPKKPSVRSAIYKYMSLPSHRKINFWNEVGYDRGWKKDELQHEQDKIFFKWVEEQDRVEDICNKIRNDFQ